MQLDAKLTFYGTETERKWNSLAGTWDGKKITEEIRSYMLRNRLSALFIHEEVTIEEIVNFVNNGGLQQLFDRRVLSVRHNGETEKTPGQSAKAQVLIDGRNPEQWLRDTRFDRMTPEQRLKETRIEEKKDWEVEIYTIQRQSLHAIGWGHRISHSSMCGL